MRRSKFIKGCEVMATKRIGSKILKGEIFKVYEVYNWKNYQVEIENSKGIRFLVKKKYLKVLKDRD